MLLVFAKLRHLCAHIVYKLAEGYNSVPICVCVAAQAFQQAVRENTIAQIAKLQSLLELASRPDVPHAVRRPLHLANESCVHTGRGRPCAAPSELDPGAVPGICSH